jgi:twitching motility two-component system response regulator PilH
MSLIGQIKSILNQEDPGPAQRGNDRRQKKRLSHKGRKILVIDDSPTVAASFSKIFRSAGCVVRDAFDAETGLEIACDERPDLIFLDIVLPGMNGFAALRQLRRVPRTRHIPVIVISGNEQAIGQFYAKRIGADDFMKKPFSREDVFKRVEILVAKGKLARLDMPRNRKGEASSAKTPRDKAEPPAGMTVLEARRQLASMGLQYFNQEQFSAAIDRRDKLAIDLFVIGGGINA